MNKFLMQHKTDGDISIYPFCVMSCVCRSSSPLPSFAFFPLHCSKRREEKANREKKCWIRAILFYSEKRCSVAA